MNQNKLFYYFKHLQIWRTIDQKTSLNKDIKSDVCKLYVRKSAGKALKILWKFKNNKAAKIFKTKEIVIASRDREREKKIRSNRIFIRIRFNSFPFALFPLNMKRKSVLWSEHILWEVCQWTVVKKTECCL